MNEYKIANLSARLEKGQIGQIECEGAPGFMVRGKVAALGHDENGSQVFIMVACRKRSLSSVEQEPDSNTFIVFGFYMDDSRKGQLMVIPPV